MSTQLSVSIAPSEIDATSEGALIAPIAPSEIVAASEAVASVVINAMDVAACAIGIEARVIVIAIGVGSVDAKQDDAKEEDAPGGSVSAPAPGRDAIPPSCADIRQRARQKRAMRVEAT